MALNDTKTRFIEARFAVLDPNVTASSLSRDIVGQLPFLGTQPVQLRLWYNDTVMHDRRVIPRSVLDGSERLVADFTGGSWQMITVAGHVVLCNPDTDVSRVLNFVLRRPLDAANPIGSLETPDETELLASLGPGMPLNSVQSNSYYYTYSRYPPPFDPPPLPVPGQAQRAELSDQQRAQQQLQQLSVGDGDDDDALSRPAKRARLDVRPPQGARPDQLPLQTPMPSAHPVSSPITNLAPVAAPIPPPEGKVPADTGDPMELDAETVQVHKKRVLEAKTLVELEASLGTLTDLVQSLLYPAAKK